MFWCEWTYDGKLQRVTMCFRLVIGGVLKVGSGVGAEGSVTGAEGAGLFAAGGLCRIDCGGDGEVGSVAVNAFEKRL